MLMTCCKLLLSLAAALTTGTAISPTVFIIAVCIVGLVQLYATVCYQPLFNVEWNKMNGGLAAVFAWAAVSTLMAAQRDRPDDQVNKFRIALFPSHGVLSAMFVILPSLILKERHHVSRARPFALSW
jgi:hypothetical protein